MARLKIGIAGGGVGGMAAAIALRKAGHDVEVFEQATDYRRVGADINLTPNAVHALDGLGVVAASKKPPRGRPTASAACGTPAKKPRGLRWRTKPSANTARRSSPFIAPICSMHCGGNSPKRSSSSVIGSRPSNATRPIPGFVSPMGRNARSKLLVGADGIHSPTRTALFGPEHPQFTGLVSYRAVVDRTKLSLPNLDAFTKWWGPTPDLQIVTFPLNRGRETFVFATTAQSDWRHESWTMPGDVEELRKAYADFHPEARACSMPATA